jgi:hypothetical protein
LLAVVIQVNEPMDKILKTALILADHLAPEQLMDTHTLCNQVYEDELQPCFEHSWR